MKKKVLALIMAAAVTFGMVGMSTTAFAAANGTIVVTGSGIEEGQSDVKYGRIVKPDRESALGWQFESTEIGKVFVNGWNGNTNLTADVEEDEVKKVIEALITLGKVEDVNNYCVKNGFINTDPMNGANFAKALEAVKGYANQDISKATNLGNGLYIIKAERQGYTYLPMAAYIDTDGKGVDVKAKGAADKVTKTVATDGMSVEAGDIVMYTIEDMYPYFPAGASNTTYIITDELTNATFIQNDENHPVTVEINDSPVESVKPNYNDDKKMTIDMGTYNADHAGKKVEITYFVKVGDVDTTNNLINIVTSQKAESSTNYKVTSDSAKLEITKTEKKKEGSNDPDKYLKGAIFTVYREATADEIKDPNVKKETMMTSDGEKNLVVFGVTDETGEDGKTTIEGLDYQKTYYVKETTAPEGYSLNEEVKTVSGQEIITSTPDADGNGTTHKNVDFSGITIDDTKLSTLPSTGGIGTTIFTIGGCAIMIAAAGIFFVSRKKEEEV